MKTPTHNRAAPPRTAAESVAARGTVTVSLQFPIQAHGEEVHELTLRRPTAGDLAQCEGKGDIGMTLHLIHLCGGVPPSSVAQLDAVDLATIGEHIGGFFGNGQPTGRKA